MKRRNLLIALGGAAGASGLIGTGAFTSVTADRDVTVNVADDTNGYLGFSASQSANGEFASVSGDEIALDFDTSDGGGSGVGLDSTYNFDDVFTIENQGTQTIYVWANFSGEDLNDDDIWFYPNSDPTKRLNDGDNSVVTLPVGEQVNVGVHIDTSILSSTDDQSLTATLTADVDIPDEDSTPRDPAGGDAAVVSKNPDQGEYSSIQAAIDAVDGTTVYVEPGVYEETVNADVEGLTLASTQGRDDTTIGDPDGQTLSGPVLQVNAPDVTVDGFEIAGASGGGESGQGVDVNGDANDTNNTVLRNLRVRGNDDRGVVVDYSENVLIENVISEDNYDRDGMGSDPPEDGFGSPGDADGFTFYYTDNSTLKNVTARRNGDNGIYIKGNDNTVDGATVGDNGDEGLDLSSDSGGGGDPDGGATVKNLTTNGNSAQEVAIEGHANNVTIESSDLTLGSNGSSPPEPAGISVTNMDGGTVTITGTDFGFGADDDPVLAYVSDSAGAIDLDATLNDNSNNFDPNAEIEGSAIVPENLNIVRAGDSIQTAIGNASQGDTIAVEAGTFDEKVNIDTADITLFGAGRDETTIDAAGKERGIAIEEDGVRIQDLTVDDVGGTDVTSGEVEGIFVGDANGFTNTGSDVVIRNVDITDVSGGADDKSVEGIHAKSYGTDTIDGLVIDDVTIDGVDEPGWGADGIKLQADIRNVTIRDSTIRNVEGSWAYGVVLTPSSVEPGIPKDVGFENTLIEDITATAQDLSDVGVGIDSDTGDPEPATNGGDVADPAELSFAGTSTIRNADIGILDKNTDVTLSLSPLPTFDNVGQNTKDATSNGS
jgi:parallel beta-helix repeat protein